MVTKTELAKKAVSTIVGFGAGKIVSSIIHNNVQPATVIDQVTVGSATMVFGYLAADISSAYTDSKIDKLVAWWDANVTKKETTKS